MGNELAQTTAKRLRMALAERAITQQQLAELSSVSKASISQYMHARNTPSSHNARAMSAILGVVPEWLMGFGDDDIEKYIDPTYSQIIEIWKNLTFEQRTILVNTAAMFAKQNMETDS